MPATRPTSALVLGGGLAGMAAAVRLAEHGVRVTLVEAAKHLGGRASSFDDPVLGRIDRGQHVTMGVCRNHLDFLDRVGTLGDWSFDDAQTWVSPDGRTSALRPSPLPRPLAFAPAVATARFLSLNDKARLAAAGLALLGATPEPGQSFEDFLLRHGQSRSLIERLWEPVAVGACNLSCRDLDAALALSVVRRGFLADASNARIGVAARPLGDLYDRVGPIVTAAGGRLLTPCRIESFDARSATTKNGETLQADVVVCALSARQAARLRAPALATDDRFDKAAAVGSSPIICVHLRYDRPVMPDPHRVLLGRTADWFFSQDGGSRVAGVISAASPLDDTPLDDIAARVAEDARWLFREAQTATLLRSRAIRERDATFAATPAVQRPSTTGPSGVLLAGDYTDTGWPATMESAVLSGYRAAAAALGHDQDHLLAPAG
ncbi:MAG: hydroxysqualene dehydroxylase HpnE [Planctomycetota bacterium]